MAKTQVINNLYLIQQAGSLMQTYRSHKRHLNSSFDNIASHSYLVSVMSYCITRMEGLAEKDAMKAVTMAVIHDFPEARTGDLDFVSKNYVKSNVNKAVRDQFKNLKYGKDLINLFEEYESRNTKISQIVRDADSLAQIYHEWVLAWQGNKLAEKWFQGEFIARIPYLFTNTAKKLAHAMKDSNPNEWWWKELVDKEGNAKTKEHLLGKNFRILKK